MKKYAKIILSLSAIASLSVAQTENLNDEIVIPLNAINMAKSCQNRPSDIKINISKADTTYTLNWFIESSKALAQNDNSKLAFLINSKNTFLQKSNFLDLKNSFENDECMNSIDVIAQSFGEFRARIKSALETSKKVKVDSKMVLNQEIETLKEQYRQKNSELSTLLANKIEKNSELKKQLNDLNSSYNLSKQNLINQSKKAFKLKDYFLKLEKQFKLSLDNRSKLYEKISDLDNINRAYKYKTDELKKQLKVKNSEIKVLNKKVSKLKDRKDYTTSNPVYFVPKSTKINNHSDEHYEKYFN